MPLVAFMFVGSDNLIHLVLGQQWMGASELFRILAFAAFMQTVGSTRGVVLLSFGKSRKYLVLGAVRAVFICLSFVIGLPWGAKGVAMGYVAANYLLLYPSIYYAFKDTPVKVNDFFIAVYKPLTASLVMGAFGSYLIKSLSAYGDIAALSLCFIGSFCVYFLIFILVSGGLGVLKGYYHHGRMIFIRD
jgi:PST family polysaccharide transporter